MVAGTHSSVGKTTASLCIAAALKKRGFAVQPFKVGPDFIDPTHYSFCNPTVIPAVNLDVFMMGEEGVEQSFKRWLSDSDFGIVEGVMGLYDGYKLTTFASSAHVARILSIPVILVMDVKGMANSALAVFKGFKTFEDVNIAGVIFRGVSEAYFQRIRRLFENEGVRVFGYIPDNDALKIPSRHLGLKLGMEVEKDWKAFAETGESYLDIDRILEASAQVEVEEYYSSKAGTQTADAPTIGIPFDSCFAFYYADNLDVLKKIGKLEFFSPLKGELPQCDAYYIGGGYPELYPELSPYAKKFAKICQDEIPVYAECGGMMFLAREIRKDESGSNSHSESKSKIKMAGVLDLDIIFTQKLQALGYVKGEIIRSNPIFRSSFRGHEFHYSYAEADDDVVFAFKTDGKGIKGGYDGAMVYKTVAGYSHIHFFSTKISMECKRG
jgi:cobyrinic acid a,c-diamide synthase